MAKRKTKPINWGELLTVEQVAERLGLTISTVRQYSRAPLSRLTPVRVFGGVAYEPAEVERYSREKRVYTRKS